MTNNKLMAENKFEYEVQTYTLCGGWINCWTVDDQPQQFETIEDAQAELDEFFEEIEDEIRNKSRKPDEGYCRSEFRIRPVR